MADYRFDDDYSEQLTLDSGTEVQLRLLRPDDAPLLLEGFAKLSESSRYSRFFGARNKLTTRELEYLTHPDGINHVAIGAGILDSDGNEHGAGVARFIRDRERPEVADVAVAVIDELHHQGLGTELVRRLVDAARERGVKRLRFEVLATNATMLSLLHDLMPGFKEQIRDGVASGEISIVDD